MTADRSTETPSLRDRLRAAVPVAMKARDRTATAALRSALAAIDNAEAVDGSDVQAGAIESSAVGLGAAERERRILTEADIEAIVRAEIADRRTAASEYDGLSGGAERAASLRAEAAALTAQLDS
ncbi:GatB/YqeY domain-containing protein [Nocardia yamanashiensis]|uniref:GatB/YqeY domain-containing protein n=1 Tax=Nocardia yamanashiensis TaxID=209247 RepID=UPI001E4D891D|nr:GatB/YqeY domain-containing protein [Nocardia yamanashiensis]UGT42145.1 GatB/YqeY domain-containing protein [Nocardia yamanashiensis]